MTLKTEPQSLQKPTAESAIADARRLLDLGEPRYAAVAARNALQVLLLDAYRTTNWPTEKRMEAAWHTHAHVLVASNVISSELRKRIERAFKVARHACHVYALTMEQTHCVIETAEKLYSVVKGKAA